MKNYKNFQILILIGIVGIIIGSILRPIMLNNAVSTQSALMVDGVLDVSTLDFSEGIYQLGGMMETYPNHFVEPSALERPAFQYQEMPYAWDTKSGVTFGSYRFLLTGLKEGELYGFYLHDALTSFEVFVDGETIALLGKPSEIQALTQSDSKVQTAHFVAHKPNSEVVIHVSSQSSHLMGIWQKTYFGPMTQIQEFAIKARQIDAFIIGAIFFMSIYVWILFAIMKEDKAILYFALICTLVTFKALLSGQQIGFESFPFLDYTLGLKLAYMMVPGIYVTIVAFAGEVFQGITWPKFMKFGYILSAIQAILIFIMPQNIYQATFVYYQALILITVCIILYWAFKALKEKREGAIIYTVGYVVFCAAAINDTLYSMLIVQTGYYLSFGLFIMILAQAAILAQRMQRALRTEEYLKHNLEHLVDVRTKELELEKNKFENLSKVDSLTLLYNKGYLSEMLHFEFESYKRYRGAFSVLMMDLDYFKVVNDTYGHVIGDEVLKRVASTLTEHSRRSDIVGRFGGEEFLIILRFTNQEDAIQHAEHLRRHIQEIKFEFGEKIFSLTASFGVSSVSDHLLDERQLLHEADEALYKAKNKGRNCVVSYK